MDIITPWNEKRAALLGFVGQNNLLFEAVGERYRLMLDELRLSAMAGQTNPVKKQMIGVLFAQACQDTEWLRQLPTLARAKVLTPRTASAAETPAGKSPLKLTSARALLQGPLKLAQNPLFALIALGVVFVLALVDKSYSAAAIAALLFAAQYITNDPFHRDASATRVERESPVSLELDADVLLSTLDAHIQTLQHRLDDLSILDEQQKADDEIPRWLLAFIQNIWEAAQTRQPADCENLCAIALLRYRLKPVSFDGTNADLFKWLRSASETAMIFPAIVRVDTGTVMLPGKAISPNA